MRQPLRDRFLGGQRKLNVVVGFCALLIFIYECGEPTRHAIRSLFALVEAVSPPVVKDLSPALPQVDGPVTLG